MVVEAIHILLSPGLPVLLTANILLFKLDEVVELELRHVWNSGVGLVCLVVETVNVLLSPCLPLFLSTNTFSFNLDVLHVLELHESKLLLG